MKKSKFEIPKPPLKDRVKNFMASMLFWRGRKKGIIHTRNITFKDVKECFFPKPGYEYDHLGYAYYNINEDGTLSKHDQIIKDFLQQVDAVVKPKYCPRFVLRLLDLFGNDKSIVRVRNWRLHNMFVYLTGGIRITDMKWKWDTFRIYGSFPDELDKLAQETCRKLEEEYADED
jgi:hypothetical protein